MTVGFDEFPVTSLVAGAVARAVLSATPTTTTVEADPTFVPPGQPIYLSATVGPLGAGGTPTGTVTFNVDGVPQAPVPLTFIDVSDMATLVLPSLPEGTHQISATYSGDAAFAPSMSAAPTQVVVSLAARAITTTTVTADPNPAASGQRIILTASITSTPAPPPSATPSLAVATPALANPTGTVTFFVDGAAAATAPFQAINGVSGLAQAFLPSLPAGTHQIVAAYSGDGAFTPSTSAPFVETVGAAPATDGPRVTSLLRYGFHAQPTLLVITFDGPLAPATAQDAANYRVVGPVGPRGKGGRVDQVTAALYDAAAHTVTLGLSQRLDLHRRYELTIDGMAPGGVSSPDGVLLDGAGTGRPGSNFATIFGREILAGPARAINRAAQARQAAALHRASVAAATANRHARA